jgi:hypothetical protein
MPQCADTSGSIAQFVQVHLYGLAAADQAFVTGWLKAVQRRNCQPATRKTYCGALKTFVHSWDGHQPSRLLQVQRTHIEQFLDDLQRRGLQPSTVNNLARRCASLLPPPHPRGAPGGLPDSISSLRVGTRAAPAGPERRPSPASLRCPGPGLGTGGLFTAVAKRYSAWRIGSAGDTGRRTRSTTAHHSAGAQKPAGPHGVL